MLALLTACALLALSVHWDSYAALASEPVCRPFVYETILGLPPVGTRVRFEFFEDGALRERGGHIVAYYWLPCWPGEPVFGLEDVAYVIDFDWFQPAGNEAFIILNRSRFEVIA
jgi:hypothetical protein